jgi:hypothetical protein
VISPVPATAEPPSATPSAISATTIAGDGSCLRTFSSPPLGVRLTPGKLRGTTGRVASARISRRGRHHCLVFFRLNSWELGLIILAVVGGATLAGHLLGRYLHEHSSTLREPFGVLQAALLGVVGLILAFGLTLAVGRYEDRRAATVAEANAIGTTYLRAQLIAEPARSESLNLLRRYTDLALAVSTEVPNSPGMRRTTAAEGVVQRQLWRLAGQALAVAPVASAPRLYVDSLNTTIDDQSARLSTLNNRVPGAVLGLELIGAAIALGLLALHISLLGRGLIPMLAAAGLVTLLLLVTFDLDRPTRGLIKVPSSPLVALRASMSLPPAATGP